MNEGETGKNQAIVSIIIPIYNSARYLNECLESVTSQTLREIEILCIDDGSSDASPELLDAWAERDSRIVAVHQENLGVSQTRNYGMDKARGEYILFVDSDDFIAPQTCRLLVDEAKLSEADIVVFGGKTFPTQIWSDRSFSTISGLYIDQGVEALFVGGSYPLMCNKLYRRAFLEEHGLRLNADLEVGEDNAFQFTAFPQAKRIVFIPDVLYFYRIHSASLNTVKTLNHGERLMRHFAVVRYVWHQWKKLGLVPRYAKESITWSENFLFEDVVRVPYNLRRSFARQYFEALDDYLDGLDPLTLDVERYMVDSFAFMKQALVAADEKPLASIFIADLGGWETEEPMVFESLELQAEQRIEFLLPRFEESAPLTPFIEAWARRDCRVRIMDAAPAPKLLAAARAEHVLVAGKYATYARHCVSLMEDCLQLGADLDALTELTEPKGESTLSIDMIIFSDEARLLSFHDPYDAYYPVVTKDHRRKHFFSASELEGKVLTLWSSAPYNKYVRKDFLMQAMTSYPQVSSWYALYAQAMITAKRIFVRPVSPMKLAPSRRTIADARNDATMLVSWVKEARFALTAANVSPIMLADCERASSLFSLAMLCLISNEASYREAYGLIHEALIPITGADDELLTLWEQRSLEILSLSDAKTAFSEQIVQLFQWLQDVYRGTIMGLEFERHTTFLAHREINRLHQEVDRLRQEISRLACENKELASIYESTSFRVGRMITFIPRKLLGRG